LIRKGLYPEAPRLPLVPGYEIAGEIKAVGKNVAREFLTTPVIAFTRFGGYSEYVIVPAGHFFPMPESMSFETGAAIPVAYCTAYLLTRVLGCLRPGDNLLIQNAGGAVGLAAFELARQAGATVYGTAGVRKHDYLKNIGFADVFDYYKPSWTDEAQDLLAGRGFDLIIDPVGGKSWRKSYQMLGPGGRLGMYGISSSCENRGFCTLKLLQTVFQMPVFHPLSLLNQNKGVFGVNMARLWNASDKIGSWMQHILRGFGEGWIRPRVDRVFSFNEAALAHRYIESRQNIGKVILIPQN
jgi:NADPH:quinone reductase-like Zn-dependent oxidoreductase